MVVPRSATPTVPPIWRVELRSPEARPEVSGADETNTPAVIAGMTMPILMPSNPRPIGIGHNAEFNAPATSTPDPIAPRAKPREMRGLKFDIPFLWPSRRLAMVGRRVNGVIVSPVANASNPRAFCR